MTISYQKPSAEEYNELRINSNMSDNRKESLKNIETALLNSLFIITLREQGKLIGMGRIVGDGGLSYIVSDIMVDTNYQGKGYGKRIMQEIDNYFESHTDQDAYITLIAVKPADQLYKKFGFNNSEPTSCGMIRKKYLAKEQI